MRTLKNSQQEKAAIMVAEEMQAETKVGGWLAERIAEARRRVEAEKQQPAKVEMPRLKNEDGELRCP